MAFGACQRSGRTVRRGGRGIRGREVAYWAADDRDGDICLFSASIEVGRCLLRLQLGRIGVRIVRCYISRPQVHIKQRCYKVIASILLT